MFNYQKRTHQLQQIPVYALRNLVCNLMIVRDQSIDEGQLVNERTTNHR